MMQLLNVPSDQVTTGWTISCFSSFLPFSPPFSLSLFFFTAFHPPNSPSIRLPRPFQAFNILTCHLNFYSTSCSLFLPLFISDFPLCLLFFSVLFTLCASPPIRPPRPSPTCLLLFILPLLSLLRCHCSHS